MTKYVVASTASKETSAPRASMPSRAMASLSSAHIIMIIPNGQRFVRMRWHVHLQVPQSDRHHVRILGQPVELWETPAKYFSGRFLCVHVYVLFLFVSLALAASLPHFPNFSPAALQSHSLLCNLLSSYLATVHLQIGAPNNWQTLPLDTDSCHQSAFFDEYHIHKIHHEHEEHKLQCNSLGKATV